ncbi:MAG: M56 family metallopeptidase [Flavobacteriales bacterium]|nr:M56 family metallopeptidase [Flavobacteriales bacterium]
MIRLQVILLVWGLVLFLTRKKHVWEWRRMLVFGIPSLLFAAGFMTFDFGPISEVGFLSAIELPEVVVSDSESSLPSLTMLIWIAGALFMAVRYLTLNINMRSIKKRSEEVQPGIFMLHSQDEYMGAFSYWKWIFIPRTEDVNLAECMIAHEKVHRNRFHSLEKTIIHLCQVIFWFNPGVHLLNKVLSDWHEAEADALTLKSVNQQTYVNALLSSAMGLNQMHAFVHPFSNKKHIKTRINMIHSKKKSYWLLAGLMVITVVGVGLQSCKQSDNVTPDSRVVNTTADVMASFPGGQQAMFEYIHDNLKYPKSESSQGVEGKVMVGFTITAEGEIEKVNIKRGVSQALDEAAIEVVESFPKWNPSIKDGQKVASELVLPILFQLED